MPFRRLYPIIPVLILLAGCRPVDHSSTPDPEYLEETEAWHKRRIDALTGDSGWLNLVGLYWLDEGTFSFGSAADGDLVFPSAAPAHIGTFEVTDTTVVVVVDPGVEVTVDGQPIYRMPLLADTRPEPEAPTMMALGHLRWWLIERDGRFGIRLRDLSIPVSDTFQGIERYPVDAEWRIQAKLEAHAEPVEIAVPNILGHVTQERSPGTLVFEIDGETRRLDPTGDLTSSLFIVFADRTTGRDTYGGGRFLYVAPPDSGGYTVIDFNRAYNPPCAFTAFSTCPQPPAQNRMSVAVQAGEKTYRQTP